MQQDKKPDWAPDNCPPNVVQLIEHDDFLNQLKLRGLASADSKTVHTAVERLKRLLIEQHHAGHKRGLVVGIALGLVLAGLVFSVSVLL